MQDTLLTTQAEAEDFLRSLGFRVTERVVREVVATLRQKNGRSERSLHAVNKGGPQPICGHGTVSRIKRFYQSGALQPYVDYLYAPVPGDSKEEEEAPAFGRWTGPMVPDDAWRWWPADKVRRCPDCECLNLRTATECQRCEAVFGG